MNPKHGKPITILMADDDADDRLMTKEAFEESGLVNDLRFVEDGVELMEYLRREGKYSDPANSPRPGLILLDLNMPKKDGREALKEIKSDPNLKSIRIVILTTSNAGEDIFRTYDLSAASYITKPVTFDGMAEVIKTLGKYWLEIVELSPTGNGTAGMAKNSNTKTIRVLIIEDDPDDYYLTAELLTEAAGGKFALDWAKDFEAGREAIKNCDHDAYLLDYRLGARDGVELVTEAVALGCKNPLILLTGVGDHAVAMKALDAGASDYLVKGKFDAESLERTIRYSIEQKKAAELLEEKVRERTAELEQRNATLRESEEFNRSLMQGSTDCVKVLDLDGRLLMMNEAGMCVMEIDDFGEFCGQAWSSLWPAEAVADIERSVKRAIAGEASTFEAFCPTAKGTPKWWEISVSPVRASPDGPVVRLLAVSRDITQRRHSEDALREVNSELTRFNSVACGRELRMIELKKEVNQLLAARGEPARYPLEFET